ncbi:Na+/H+ antiporter subunit E [Cysteiniphilum halobium]|uniref:Na+/H+ antiporter subunit E n=1 Tax=Cysteiniphilum halobium TaxID=2219059 RepID=UPI003F858B57
MKNDTLMIIFLTFIWCGFSNNFIPLNILLGLIVALICHFAIPKYDGITYRIRPLALLYLVIFCIKELFKSSILVAWDVITPKKYHDPIMVSIDLNCHLDIEVTLLANLISLTPGTLSIDISKNRQKLLLHVMFGQQPEEVKRFIKQKLEPKVMKVFRYATTQ